MTTALHTWVRHNHACENLDLSSSILIYLSVAPLAMIELFIAIHVTGPDIEYIRNTYSDQMCSGCCIYRLTIVCTSNDSHTFPSGCTPHTNALIIRTCDAASTCTRSVYGHFFVKLSYHIMCVIHNTTYSFWSLNCRQETQPVCPISSWMTVPWTTSHTYNTEKPISVPHMLYTETPTMQVVSHDPDTILFSSNCKHWTLPWEW